MFKKTLLTISLISAFGAQAAPLVLEGDFIKIGVNEIGTLGSNGNASPGVLYDNTGTGTFNTAYDYLTPGSPFEGWTVQYNGTESVMNNNSQASSPQMTGTLTSYDGVAYNGTTFDNRAVWEGTSVNFDLLHDVRFNDNQKYVDITSVLTAKVAMTDLYFARYTDPDARAADGDSSRTTNTLGFSPIPETQVVFSEALVSKYALGLYSAAPNVGAGVSAGWSTDATTYHTGTNDGDGDYTIGLGFHVPTVAIGDIVTFQYAYIFGPSTLSAGTTAVTSGAGGGTAGVVPGCVTDCTLPPDPSSTPTLVSTDTEMSSVSILHRGDTATSIDYAYATSRGSKALSVTQTTETTLTTPVTTTIATTPTTVETYSDSSVVRTVGTTTTTATTVDEVVESEFDTAFSTKIDQYDRLSSSNEMYNRQLNSGVMDRYTSKQTGAYLNIDNQKSNTSDTYKQKANRFGVGYDRSITDNLVVGFQFNNISSRLNGLNAGGKLDKNHVGAYSIYTKNDWVFVNDIGASYNQYKTNHSLSELNASNSSSANGYDLWFSGRAYTPSLKGFRPYVGARVEHNTIDSVSEKGTALTAVDYSKVNSTNTSAEYGIRYDYQIKKVNLLAEAGSNSDNIKLYRVGASFVPNEKLVGGLTYTQQEYQSIKNDIIFANLKVLF
jgi:hypothetical protein